MFIYTCPPGSTIKERMLYASCRAAVVSTVENECGLKIDRKVGSVVSPLRLAAALTPDSWKQSL